MKLFGKSFILKKEFDFNYFKTKILNKITITTKKVKSPLTLGDLRSYMLASSVNLCLEKYRNIFADQDVLIVGGGPSLKYLWVPEKTIKIGINRAYKLKDIKFDFLYAQDEFPDAKEMNEFAEYRQDTCVKLLGILTGGEGFSIRPSTINSMKNKQMLVLNNRHAQDGLRPIDIAAEPLMRFRGSVFAVLQFAFFASARKIYLAGFDCNDSGHMFTNIKEYFKLSYQKESWERIKMFRDLYYPATEIISINPVGLRGMFRDVYTQSYLADDPELSKHNVIVLKN